MTESAETTPCSLSLLNETEGLLREGLRRIADSTGTEIPGAQPPLQEALQLTEEQAMATITAVEEAQRALAEIRATRSDFINMPLSRIESALHTILASQQAQDLAGQRLKKAIILLSAAEERIRKILDETGIAREERGTAKPSGIPDSPIEQDELDDLLASLGI